MPFDSPTDPPPVCLHPEAPEIVTAWPRRLRGGSGSHAIALSRDDGRVEPDRRYGGGAKTQIGGWIDRNKRYMGE